MYQRQKTRGEGAAVRFSTAAAALLLIALPCLGADAGLSDALVGGKPQWNLRLRYENVRDDALARDASAPTFRLRFGYETLKWRHASLLLEVDQLGVWAAEDYNSTRNGKIDRPIVSDPPATDLNQAALKLSYAQDDFILGRQRLVLDNQRFIGGSAWRQNEQTFDAALWRLRAIPSVTITYAYLDNINRVFGPDAGTPPPDLRVRGNLLHAALDLKAAGKVAIFGHWLDIRTTPALSHENLGVLWTGSYAISSDWKLPWSASYVQQRDYGDNPTPYHADYYQLELGLAREGFSIRVGEEDLGGDATRNGHRFQTPLATLHAFQGWADKFLTTPPQGIRDSYIAATARYWGVDSQLAWHDFRASAVQRRYGSEWDVSLARKLSPHTELLLKAASYDSGGLASDPRDTRKLWLQLVVNYP